MRNDTIGLKEIDADATQGKTKDVDAQDLATLNIIRTGSTWTQTASFWTGKVSDQFCTLCGEEKETPDQLLWKCECLEEQRKIHDKELAALDPDELPASMRIGIAANPLGPFWGATYMKA